MESLVDITTTTFQAIVAVCVVFTAGYAYNSQRSAKLAEVSDERRPFPIEGCLILSPLS
jgi:hypothetical protein